MLLNLLKTCRGVLALLLLIACAPANESALTEAHGEQTLGDNPQEQLRELFAGLWDLPPEEREASLNIFNELFLAVVGQPLKDEYLTGMRNVLSISDENKRRTLANAVLAIYLRAAGEHADSLARGLLIRLAFLNERILPAADNLSDWLMSLRRTVSWRLPQLQTNRPAHDWRELGLYSAQLSVSAAEETIPYFENPTRFYIDSYLPGYVIPPGLESLPDMLGSSAFSVSIEGREALMQTDQFRFLRSALVNPTPESVRTIEITDLVDERLVASSSLEARDRVAMQVADDLSQTLFADLTVLFEEHTQWPNQRVRQYFVSIFPVFDAHTGWTNVLGATHNSDGVLGLRALVAYGKINRKAYAIRKATAPIAWVPVSDELRFLFNKTATARDAGIATAGDVDSWDAEYWIAARGRVIRFAFPWSLSEESALDTIVPGPNGTFVKIAVNIPLLLTSKRRDI